MKIVHVALQHPPRDSRIYHKECLSLSEAHEVYLLHPDNVSPDREPVHRVAALKYPDYGGSVLRWVVRYIRCMAGNLRLARDLGADIYHIHETPLIPLGIGLRMAGSKVVYDVHEDAPRQAISNGINMGRPSLGYAYAVVCWCYESLARRLFNGFVAATPEIGRKFPPGRTAVVRNFVLKTEMDALDASANCHPYGERPMQAVYVGGLTGIRGVRELVGAAGKLDPSTGFRLVLAGRFESSSLQDECRELAGWSNVDFLGELDRSGIISTLSVSRVGLVTIHPVSNYLDSWPVKLFEYMAAGLPVIASDFPEWRKRFGKFDCIRFVDPLNISSIARELVDLLENQQEAEVMGRRGRKAVQEWFNWDDEAKELGELYARVLDGYRQK